MDKIKKRLLIKAINEMIESAIYYGGDSGGAYFNEEDKVELLKKMEYFRVWKLGDDFAIGFVNEIPMFFEKYDTKTSD